MAWVAINENGDEYIFSKKPIRKNDWIKFLAFWIYSPAVGYWDSKKYIEIPKGSIKKLIGRDLTWEDEPVELK